MATHVVVTASGTDSQGWQLTAGGGIGGGHSCQENGNVKLWGKKIMGITCYVSCAGCYQPPCTGLGNSWPGPADALYSLDRILEYPELEEALKEHQVQLLI